MLKKFTLGMNLKFLVGIVIWIAIFKLIVQAVSPSVENSVMYTVIAIMFIAYIYYANSWSKTQMNTFWYRINLVFTLLCLITGIIMCFTGSLIMWGILLIFEAVLHYIWLTADDAGGTLGKSLVAALILLVSGYIMCFISALAYVGMTFVAIGNLVYFSSINKHEVADKKLFKLLSPIMLVLAFGLSFIGLLLA